MKYLILRIAVVGAFALAASPAASPAWAKSDDCASLTGDAVLSARTPQVDLYDGPSGKRIKSLDDDKFPTCLAVTQRAPNMTPYAASKGGVIALTKALAVELARNGITVNTVAPSLVGRQSRRVMPLLARTQLLKHFAPRSRRRNY